MKIGREKLHLLHIRDAVEKVLEYSSEISYKDFLEGRIYYDAILMQVVVIGEAVNDLSDEFKEAHHNLPWYEAVGMRNRIAHGYLDVDPEIIWAMIKKDLPSLKKQIKQILENL